MRRVILTAATAALLAISIGAWSAFARAGDHGVLLGRVVSVDLNNNDDDRLDAITLRVTDNNEPVDDGNFEPSFYRIDVNGDTSVDLNGKDRHDLVGEHALVQGNDLNVGDRRLTANQLVILSDNGNGNDNSSNDNGNSNGNGNDNSGWDGDGSGMADAVQYGVDHVPAGWQRGAFLRCVYNQDINGASLDDSTFEHCANQVS